ncbi:hypothetical protein HKD37_14G040475 [Glycine soja]
MDRSALISGFRLSMCFSCSANGLKRCASLDDPSLSKHAQLILLPDSSSRSVEGVLRSTDGSLSQHLA